MEVDIYLVTRERSWYLFATLDALHKNTRVRHRIFVADNGSKSKDIAVILNRFKHNRRAINGYMRFKTNRVSARDDLIRRFPPRSRYMVIMDDDFLVPRGWLGALMRFVEKRPEYGVVSLMPDPIDKPDRHNPLTPMQWRNRQLLAIPHKSDGEIYRTSLVEGLMFTPTDLFKKVGSFVRGRIYSRAARKAGYRVGYLKQPMIRHLGYNMYYDYPSYLRHKTAYFKKFRKR